VAVDNLVEGFAKAGVKPLRVAHGGGSGTATSSTSAGKDANASGAGGGKVRASIQQYTWEYRLSVHPLAPQLEGALRDVESLASRLKTLEEQLMDAERKNHFAESVQSGRRCEKIRRDIGFVKRQSAAKKSKVFSLKKKIAKDIVDESDVVSFVAY
jgi:hypothetical protein